MNITGAVVFTDANKRQVGTYPNDSLSSRTNLFVIYNSADDTRTNKSPCGFYDTSTKFCRL